MTDLAEILSALGVTPEEVEGATNNGTLLALAAERFLFPGERKFTSREVAERSGVDSAAMTKLWLALGFPRPASSDSVFTDRDVEVMRMLLSDGTTITEYILHEARVISAALARIAEVFVDEMWDQHFAGGQTETEALGEMAGGVDLDRIEGLLLYMLRKHIVAGIYRRQALNDRTSASGMPSVAVGFADVVGFTSLSHSLSANDLTELVVHFERSTFDLAAEKGGRVVKTIGDEVMFTFEDAPTAADFSLALAELADDQLPAIRVGLGWGPVLVRQGDCFGPTVNLASRLVGVAEGGEVVTEPAMAELLQHDPGFDVVPLRPRDLKGFGAVPLSRLSRPT